MQKEEEIRSWLMGRAPISPHRNEEQTMKLRE
jgi:hypothetical protein